MFAITLDQLLVLCTGKACLTCFNSFSSLQSMKQLTAPIMAIRVRMIMLKNKRNVLYLPVHYYVIMTFLPPIMV